MRSAVNQYGRALGIRTLRSVAVSLAAYDAMSSRAAGSTWVSPRIVLTITGKKTIAATMITRGSALWGPNQLIVIGAKAMIGTVEAAMRTGRSVSLADCQRAVARPARVPVTSPASRPPIASLA